MSTTALLEGYTAEVPKGTGGSNALRIHRSDVCSCGTKKRNPHDEVCSKYKKKNQIYEELEKNNRDNKEF
jgi:hypothetical protein